MFSSCRADASDHTALDTREPELERPNPLLIMRFARAVMQRAYVRFPGA